jgi:hypothetical protein
MSTWLIIGIIVLVLGMIVSNVLLLKYSAKMPFKSAKATKSESDKK